MLRIAIQKKGRLTNGTLDLLKRGGLIFENSGMSLVTPCQNFPLELLHLRDEDIPEAIRSGAANIGVVGENVLNEFELGLEKTVCQRILSLPFAQCRMSLALPNGMQIENIKDLDGLRVATSYPNILKDFAQKNSIRLFPIVLAGSVELATRLNMSDVIFDIVSTGETIRLNGLREFYRISDISPQLVSSLELSLLEKDLLKDLLVRIQSAITSQMSRYLMLNAPKNSLDKIISILPSIDAPTVMELSTDLNKVAVHAVVPQNIIWELIGQLKAVGATGLLILPIEAEVN